MRDGALISIQGEIENARRFLRVNQASRALVALGTDQSEPSLLDYAVYDIAKIGLSRSTWRVLDDCAAVNRIYAVFEQFVEALLGDWIIERSRSEKFGALPESIRISYSRGIADILSSLNQARYNHLSERELISGFNDALGGKIGYRLFPECLTRHKNNFRWSELAEVFARSGIDNLSDWISHSARLRDFFESDDRLSEQAESKLSELIGYRNDASHGAVEVDQILGSDALEELSDFIEALASDLMDLIRDRWTDWLIKIDNAHDIGSISEKFSANVRIAICERVTLSVGQKVVVRKARFCRMVEILELRIDDVGHSFVTVGGAKEIGLRFSEAVPLQSRIIIPSLSLGLP